MNENTPTKTLVVIEIFNPCIFVASLRMSIVLCKKLCQESIQDHIRFCVDQLFTEKLDFKILSSKNVIINYPDI